jgi:hypothetical protein
VGTDSAVASLARAAGGDGTRYRPTRDTSVLHAGSLDGRVFDHRQVVGDSAIVPTHDLDVCKPFTETRVPSAHDGVGNAVAWLVGVESGPVDERPRRASLSLDRCRLEPRVQAVPKGGTLLVTSRDAMMSRLRFVDAGAASTGTSPIRATISLTDAGQVVPNSAVLSSAGLVEIRDDLHPWVRGFIAVAPHPFVDVTNAEGVFRFEGVPAGRYTLVVWQEKLGVHSQVVNITAGARTSVSIEYR